MCGPDFEGTYNYAYLDSADSPNATIGCGINITSTPEVQLQNRHTGADFSRAEQKNQLNRLYASYRPNHKASYYRDKSDIGISAAEHEKWLRKKYKNAYQDVVQSYPDFNNLTSTQQDVLLDMHYNMGPNRFKTYELLKDAVNKKRWEDAAYHTHRFGVSRAHNEWAARAFDPELKKTGREH